MLLKIRFHLEGEAPPDPYQHARGLRALALNWIGESDPDYSKEIHDANQPKPYSIGARRQEHLRRACCFDLSVLVDALYAPILQGQQQMGATFRLGQYSYRICEVEILRPLTYVEIIRAAPETAREFRFRQATPTTAVRRFARRLCCPTRNFTSAIGGCAGISAQNGKSGGNCWMSWNGRSPSLGGTQPANIDKERNFAGFCGDVTFALLKPDTVPSEMRQGLAALAMFAEYCGTGVDTMRGMGETLLLDIL